MSRVKIRDAAHRSAAHERQQRAVSIDVELDEEHVEFTRTRSRQEVSVSPGRSTVADDDRAGVGAVRCARREASPRQLPGHPCRYANHERAAAAARYRNFEPDDTAAATS